MDNENRLDRIERILEQMAERLDEAAKDQTERTADEIHRLTAASRHFLDLHNQAMEELSARVKRLLDQRDRQWNTRAQKEGS